MSDSGELETQRQILDYISKNPGVNLTDIALHLDISIQLADYHLAFLARNDLIIFEKGIHYKRCFIKGEIGVEDKRLLALTRQETLLKIVLFLLKNPNSRHRDLCQHLGVSTPLLSYHLRKLLKHDVVVFHHIKDEKKYFLKDPKKMIRILMQYQVSPVAQRVRDAWSDFSIELK